MFNIKIAPMNTKFSFPALGIFSTFVCDVDIFCVFKFSLVIFAVSVFETFIVAPATFISPGPPFCLTIPEAVIFVNFTSASVFVIPVFTLNIILAICSEPCYSCCFFKQKCVC